MCELRASQVAERLLIDYVSPGQTLFDEAAILYELFIRLDTKI